MVELFRIVTLTLLLIVALLFPAACVDQGRRASAYYAVIGAEIMILSFIAGLIIHFHDHLLWYRGPMGFVASIFYIIFIVKVNREGRHS